MHRSLLDWGEKVLTKQLCGNARVLEVGAYNVNGSFRPLVERWKPSRYIATDCRPGPDVDVVIAACDLPMAYREMDLIICTEVLEHVYDWKTALICMWQTLKLGGTLILSTRAPGFPRHDFPSDYWRFTPEILKSWFYENVSAEWDSPTNPGVLLRAARLSSTLAIGKEALPL